MRQKPGTKQSHGERVVKDIRRATRKQYSAEEKIRIVLAGLRGEESIAAQGSCRFVRHSGQDGSAGCTCHCRASSDGPVSAFAFASLAVQSNLKVTGMGNLGQNLQNLSVVCY